MSAEHFLLVDFPSPRFDGNLGVQQVYESVFDEAFVALLAAEAYEAGVLIWLTGHVRASKLAAPQREFEASLKPCLRCRALHRRASFPLRTDADVLLAGKSLQGIYLALRLNLRHGARNRLPSVIGRQFRTSTWSTTSTELPCTSRSTRPSTRTLGPHLRAAPARPRPATGAALSQWTRVPG